jgi:hypothetical protein
MVAAAFKGSTKNMTGVLAMIKEALDASNILGVSGALN